MHQDWRDEGDPVVREEVVNEITSDHEFTYGLLPRVPENLAPLRVGSHLFGATRTRQDDGLLQVPAFVEVDGQSFPGKLYVTQEGNVVFREDE